MTTPRNIGSYISEENYLAHYGIKGQKWGLRRYQNPDGTLTAEGKKRAKAEYKEDNKKAFELGRDATVYAQAHKYAERNADRARKRYEAKPNANRADKLKIAEDVETELYNKKTISEKNAKKHLKELTKKYGDDAVNGIKYDKHGLVNERTNTSADYGLAIGTTLTSLGLSMVMNLPIAMIFTPTSKQEKGHRVYEATLLRKRQEDRG